MEKEFNGTEIASKIFSCIQSLNKKFGLNYIAAVLSGANIQKIQNYGHQNLPGYGSLKEYSGAQIKEWLVELIEQDFLYQTRNEYPVIHLKDKAALLGLKETASLKQPDPNLEKRLSALKGESIDKTVELYNQGKNLSEIAQERHISQATVIGHLAEAYRQGRKVNIDQFLEAKKEEVITRSFQKLGTDYLTPVKKDLGVAYTWEELKLVRAKLLRTDSSV